MKINGFLTAIPRDQLAIDAKALSAEKATSKQLTDIINRSNALRRRIAAWIDIQAIHMPQAILQRDRSTKAEVDGIPGVSAHEIPLCLPSSMPKRAPKNLCVYEWKLREGQSHDALENVRHHLRLRAHLYFHKKKYSRGVKQNTRSVASINACQAKIDRAVAKYNKAYEAMVAVGDMVWKDIDAKWREKIRRIQAGDARGLSQGKDGESEGNRTVSWIWQTGGILLPTAEHLYQCFSDLKYCSYCKCSILQGQYLLSCLIR